MTIIAAPSANQVESTLAASYTRGTDTTITLVDGTLFPSPTPLGHVISIRDTETVTAATKWCLIIYTSKATHVLTMGGGATDYAMAKNVSVGDEAYEWPIGSYVDLLTAADEIAKLFADVGARVTKALFDANTIIAATTNNTPAALTVAEQTLVGRITAGSIDALTVAEARALLYSQSAKVNLDGNSAPTATSTLWAVAWDDEYWDTDSIHDISTNNSRLTCKRAGKYLVMLSIVFESNDTGARQLFIREGGDTTKSAQLFVNTASGQDQCMIYALCDLATNEYVEGLIWQASGSALYIADSAATYFGMFEIL